MAKRDDTPRQLQKLQKLLVGIGGLMIVGGVILIFTVDAATGFNVLVGGAVLLGAALYIVRKAIQLSDALATSDVARTGTPATARVVSMKETDMGTDADPLVVMNLLVQGPQGPVEVQKTMIVPQRKLPEVQPGRIVNVRLDPQDPKDIAVVF